MAIIKRGKKNTPGVDESVVQTNPIDRDAVLEDMAEVAEIFGGEDALENIEEWIEPVTSQGPELVAIEKMKGKDIRTKVNVMPPKEAQRVAVDQYFTMQKNRIALANQVRAVEQGTDSRSATEIDILQWMLRDAITCESNAETIIGAVAQNSPECCWAASNHGISHVLALQLCAYLDFNKAPNASSFVSYAGLNDNKRPRISKEEATKIKEQLEKAGAKVEIK